MEYKNLPGGVSLDEFPTSPSAQKMLGYVTAGFYETSYIGKWLYQVMGQEYDTAQELIEELPYQSYPETATWGLTYHEIKWGLPVRTDLSYDERRKIIYRKMAAKEPITPYRMEENLANVTDYEVHIADINDSGKYGFTGGHPNIFEVIFAGEAEKTLDFKTAKEMLNEMKQSHTIYTVTERVETTLDNRFLEKVIWGLRIRILVPFWGCHLFNGAWLLDGSVILDAAGRYDLDAAFWFGISIPLPEISKCILVKHAITFDNQNMEKVAFGRRYYFWVSFWGCYYFDGLWEADGTVILDQKERYVLEGVVRLRAETIIQESIVGSVTSERDPGYYDGEYQYNGARRYNAAYSKEEF